MNKRSNLKVVSDPATDELETAIAAASEASAKLKRAEVSFKEHFLGDARLWNLKSQNAPDKIAFDEARREIFVLTDDEKAAQRVVDSLRLRAGEAGTEKEKRAELAAAIAAAALAGEALTAAKAIETRASNLVADAQNKFDTAVGTAKAAREQHAQGAEEAARTGASISATSLREARAAEIDALDDLEAAKSALTKFQATSLELEAASRSAGLEVANLADDVIKASSAKALLNRARKLRQDLIKRRLVLKYLLDAGNVLDVERDEVQEFLLDLDLPGGSVEYRVWDEEAAAAELPWRRALEALQRDAIAPLPEV